MVMATHPVSPDNVHRKAMKICELIAYLLAFDGQGDAQIFMKDNDGCCAYYDVKAVEPISGLPDAIIEVGAFRTGGG
jgi:hypothetical protein